MANHIAPFLPLDTVGYCMVVIVQLTSHVKSMIKAVDREKQPNEVLVHFV